MPTSVCSAHGLRYDPAVTTGCIRCNTESAASAPPDRRRFLALGVTGAAIAAASITGWRAIRRPPTDPPAPVANELSILDCGAGRAALFEPAGVPVSRAAPLILLFDPAGDAQGIVRRYSVAARSRGWLAASCSVVRNGTPSEDDARAITELFSLVNARRQVDLSRVFTGGLSGGACGAYRFAIMNPDLVGGAIVECGHMGPWREVGDRARATSRFYLFTRLNDFNRPATQALREAMARKGCRVTEVEAPGGHAPMTPDEVEPALRWMEG